MTLRRGNWSLSRGRLVSTELLTSYSLTITSNRDLTYLCHLVSEYSGSAKAIYVSYSLLWFWWNIVVLMSIITFAETVEMLSWSHILLNSPQRAHQSKFALIIQWPWINYSKAYCPCILGTVNSSLRQHDQVLFRKMWNQAFQNWLFVCFFFMAEFKPSLKYQSVRQF